MRRIAKIMECRRFYLIRQFSCVIAHSLRSEARKNAAAAVKAHLQDLNDRHSGA
jgi:hypothetical protein